jgi:uncharacterized nucleotidyltransferase DUF6036
MRCFGRWRTDVTREQLEHAIRAACDVSGDTDLYIFGSQAILGEYPDAPSRLRASIEVDLQPVNRPETVDAIDGVLGEISPFHDTYGFYVHGLSIEAATLPAGWEARTVTVRTPDALGKAENRGLCLEAHDLAASKLHAYREKDRDFVRILLVEELVSADVLLGRIAALPADDATIERLTRWVRLTAHELRHT